MTRNESNRAQAVRHHKERAAARARTAQRLAQEKRRKAAVYWGTPVDPTKPL